MYAVHLLCNFMHNINNIKVLPVFIIKYDRLIGFMTCPIRLLAISVYPVQNTVDKYIIKIFS